MGRVLVAVVIAAMLGGCTTYPKRDVNLEPLGLIYAKTEIPHSQLLGVRIAVFDPGELPGSDDKSSGLSMEIRKAEARFIPVHLKNVMQGTDVWGPIRVVPSDTPNAEVMVSGHIVESDGEVLKLDVTVRDATGALWIKKRYEGIIDLEFHRSAAAARMEPFRFLYHQIANDIARHRAWMSSDAIEEVRRVSELRFAENFAPRAFAGYLKKTDGVGKDAGAEFGVAVNKLKREKAHLASEQPRYSVQRLPAEDDPMLMRVRRIKARDDMLVDTIDKQFDGLYQQLDDPYRDWRRSRVIEVEAIRRLESERNAEVVRGLVLVVGAILLASGSGSDVSPGLVSVVGAIGVRKALDAVRTASDDAMIHKAGLTELGESFATDAEPIVIEVEGETVALTGTAEAKFGQWREILEKLRVREVGPDLSEPSNRGLPAGAKPLLTN